MVSNYEDPAFVDPESLAKAFAFRQAIDELRETEGASIEILCDNPDGPPNNAVVCSGDWTDYTDRRFEGQTVDIAIRSALIAYRKHKRAANNGD